MSTTIQDFAANWRYKGAYVMLDDVAFQFAMEWAGFVVNTLEQRRWEEEEKRKPKVIVNG